jgi:hypothetical protein
MAKAKDGSLRKGDKVVATVDLAGVPEGTTGKVKLVNGFSRPGSWMRYWVFFDNGIDLGSVGVDKLVRASAWQEFQVERAAREARGPESAAAGNGAATVSDGDEAPAGDAAADAGVASRIPAHLLERTKNRRQALGLG